MSVCSGRCVLCPRFASLEGRNMSQEIKVETQLEVKPTRRRQLLLTWSGPKSAKRVCSQSKVQHKLAHSGTCGMRCSDASLAFVGMATICFLLVAVALFLTMLPCFVTPSL